MTEKNKVTITKAYAAVEGGRIVSAADSRHEPGTTAVLVVHGITADTLRHILAINGFVVPQVVSK